MTLDVSVQFREGWLSEWYPSAINKSPGYPDGLGIIHTPGSLKWTGLEVGVDSKTPRTTEHVWLAPRQVDSARVRMPKSKETEQYLFYRGVAQLHSPIRVATSADRTALQLKCNLESTVKGNHLVKNLWLADIRPDGTVAYRNLDPVALTGGSRGLLATTSSSFAENDYRASNLEDLRLSMHAAITKAGLYEDEATAMLNTWELSYFKSSGMRLFYVLPDAWTDYQLPLTISQPADIKRVMIGRVELVTNQQEDLLRRIATAPASRPAWLAQGLAKLPKKQQEPAWQALKAGTTSVTKLDTLQVPADYRAYIQLGRFRDALILSRAGSAPALKQFAKNYGISLN